MKKKEVNLNQVVEFYNSHPGFAGAMIPIPKVIKEAADRLVGKKMSLAKALENLRKVTMGMGELGVVDRYKFISLTIKTGGLTHMFRVICYRGA